MRLVLRSAISVNGVAIRLTSERWLHITESHSELAGYLDEVLETIEAPEAVYAGTSGELLAVRMLWTDRFLVVVYKEQSGDDGFVITAFLTTRLRQIQKRQKIWPQ